MNIAIYQNGHGILGIGEDLTAALEDAQQYADDIPAINDIEMESGSGVDGVIYYAPLTPALEKQVASGRPELYELSNGILMTLAEAEED